MKQRVEMVVPEGSIMAWLLKPRFQKQAPIPRAPKRVPYSREEREKGIL